MIEVSIDRHTADIGIDLGWFTRSSDGTLEMTPVGDRMLKQWAKTEVPDQQLRLAESPESQDKP